MHSMHPMHSVPLCFLLGPSMFSIGPPFVFEWVRSIIRWGSPLFSNGLGERSESNEVNESKEVIESKELTEVNELNELTHWIE